MSEQLRWTITFGTAPVGAEVTEWDWDEDDDGYRSRYEYTIIPSECVDEDVTITGTDPRTLEVLLRMARLDPKQVVQTSVQRGHSFRCSGWERAHEAFTDLTRAGFIEPDDCHR